MVSNVKESISFTVWLHRILDLSLPSLTLYLSSLLYNNAWSDKYLILGILGGLFLVVFSQGTGVYSQWRGRTLFSGFKLAIQAWIFTWLALLALAFLLKDSSHFSRLIVTIWAFSTPIALFMYRLILRYLLGYFRTKGWNTSRVAIIGAGDLGKRLAKTLRDAKMLGYQPMEFFDDNLSIQGKVYYNIPVIASIDDFIKIESFSTHFDEVYITLPLRAEERIKQVLNALADSTVTVKFIPDCFAFDLLHSRMTDIGGMPIISVYDSPLNNLTNRFLKRLEDIILSIIILIIISPLLIVISIAVKATSPGPILFKQKRYGLNGKDIMVWKFRSMKVMENGDKVPQATKNDNRFTKIGSFLRRTSLDELPQFFNTLTGRMSIVGPRPHAKAHNEQYRKLIQKYMLRHTVKPGITGWAQINGLRGETETLDKMEKRVQYDLYYIDNWSFWMDIKIILLTLIKGFIDKNAY
jgi:putative colanic acid biosysnthesis UDP-glucose lipid carrier transferase